MPRTESHRSRTHAVLLFAGLVLALASVRHYRDDVHPANEAVRIYAAMAIVDHGTIALDPVFDEIAPGWRQAGTPPNRDAAVRDGRYLLDKAPGLTLAAVPIVAALRLAGLRPGFGDLAWGLSLLLCALPTAAFALFLARRLQRDAATATAPGWVAASLVLATPWLAYGGMLFGHAPAAALAGFGAMWALGPLAAGASSDGTAAAGHAARPHRDGFLAGLALGGAVLVELPVAALAAVLTLAVLLDGRARQRLPALLAGAAIPAATLLAWNAASFGHPLAMSYGFKGDETFAAFHAQGLYGVSWPTAERLWGVLAGARRGLLFLAPWLALGLAGAAAAALDRGLSRGWRFALSAGGLGFPVLMAGFVDWTAGASMGPRHLLAGLPLLGIGAARLLARADGAPAGAWLRPVAAGLAASSALLCAIGAWVFPYFGSQVANPVFEVALPVLLEAGFAPTCWNAWLPGAWGALPAAAGAAIAAIAAGRLDGGARGTSGADGGTDVRRSAPRVAALVMLPIAAAAHVGLAALPRSTDAGALRQVLATRATAFEMLGRDDLAASVREALRRKPAP